MRKSAQTLLVLEVRGLWVLGASVGESAPTGPVVENWTLVEVTRLPQTSIAGVLEVALKLAEESACSVDRYGTGEECVCSHLTSLERSATQVACLAVHSQTKVLVGAAS